MNRGKMKDALSELAGVVEDLFYTASLVRTAGDARTAERLAKLGEEVARERSNVEIVLRRPRVLS